MKKKANYYGATFTVDSKTLKITKDGSEVVPHLNQQLKRMYVTWIGDDGKSHLTTRARIICQAFHPVEDPSRLQADHINSDTLDDSPANLRWATRKQNNSTEHSRLMRKKNGTCHSRAGKMLQASCKATGETRLFANGREAAEQLGCSSALVYMVANKSNYQRTAKGWELEWVEDDGASEAKAARRKKLRAASLDIAKLEKQLDNVEQRIKCWSQHALKQSSQSEAASKKMAAKLGKLHDEAAQLQQQIDLLKKADA